jgi:hypothetical protein
MYILLFNLQEKKRDAADTQCAQQKWATVAAAGHSCQPLVRHRRGAPSSDGDDNQMALPISIFFLSALVVWKMPPSMRPVTVKTPPMIAQMDVRNAARD